MNATTNFADAVDSGNGNTPTELIFGDYLLVLGSALSVTGSTLWMVHQLMSKYYQMTTQRILLMLAFSDTLLGLALLTGTVITVSSDLDYTTGREWTYLSDFASKATLLWTTVLVFHALLRVRRRLSKKAEIKLEIVYNLVVWVTSLLFTLAWDPTPEENETQLDWVLWALVGLRLFIILFLLFSVLYLLRARRENPALNRTIVNRVIGFLILAVLCWFPLLIEQFLNTTGIYPELTENTSYTYFAMFMVTLWGFFSVFVYGVNTSCLSERACVSMRAQYGNWKPLRKSTGGLTASMMSGGEQSSQPLGELANELSNVEIFEVIGSGGNGIVYHGVWRGTDVAVKQIRLVAVREHLTTDQQEYFENKIRCEAAVMQELRHPRIVLFMAAGIHGGRLTIITEYMAKGSLYDVYSKKSIRWDWKLKLRALSHAAEGIVYLHSANPPYIHRDIKSMNVLLDANYHAKIGDFGTSRLMSSASIDSEQGLTTSLAPLNGASEDNSKLADTGRMSRIPMLTVGVGTLRWSAPEILRGEHDYTVKTDIYSFGMMMYEVLSSSIPFDDVRFESQVKKLVLGTKRPNLEPFEAPEGLKELIEKCWSEEASQRPCMAEVLSSLQEIQRGLSTDDRDSINRGSFPSWLLQSGNTMLLGSGGALSSYRAGGEGLDRQMPYLLSPVGEKTGSGSNPTVSREATRSSLPYLEATAAMTSRRQGSTTTRTVSEKRSTMQPGGFFARVLDIWKKPSIKDDQTSGPVPRIGDERSAVDLAELASPENHRQAATTLQGLEKRYSGVGGRVSL